MAPALLALWLVACQGDGLDSAPPPGDSTPDSRQPSDSGCVPTDEACDGQDQDCDDIVDEGLDIHTWHLDQDGDTFGDPEVAISGCETDAPDGHVGDATDCDDDDPTVHPGATEVCDDGVWNACVPDTTCRLTGFVDLNDAELIIYGEAAGDKAGRSAVRAGDLNGDGFDDLFLDAQESDVAGPESGSSYFFPGPFSPGELDLGAAPTRLRGNDTLTWSARSLAGVGDTDGDGIDDVVVGVIRDGRAGFRAGAAYIFSGPLPDGEHSLADVPGAFLYAEGEFEAVGSWTRDAGDLNGDGLADLLIAAMYSDRAGLNNGAVYVVHGPVTGESPIADRAEAIYDGEPLRDNDWAGRVVAGAGDIDGDGYDDFVVGADGNDRGGDGAGAVYLILGPVSGEHSLVTADTIYTGEFAEHRLGSAVDGAGDTDGDGQPELILGAFGHSQVAPEAGAFYLVDGTERGVVDVRDHTPFVYSEYGGERFGYYVDGLGDVDGDGFDDVLVGAPNHDGGGQDAGAAFLFYGPITTTLASGAELFLQGAGGSEYAGYSAAGAGDLDGDGSPDLLIGAFGSNRGGTTSGAFHGVFTGGK